MPKLLTIIHFSQVNRLVPGLKLLEKYKEELHSEYFKIDELL